MTPRTMKTAAPAASAPPTGTEEDELIHYTPEQVYAAGWTPIMPRTLRNKARRREIPHSRAAAKITFTLSHLREIRAMYEARPISETKPA